MLSYIPTKNIITVSCEWFRADGIRWCLGETQISSCIVGSAGFDTGIGRGFRITSYNVCYTKLLRVNFPGKDGSGYGARITSYNVCYTKLLRFSCHANIILHYSMFSRPACLTQRQRVVRETPRASAAAMRFPR